MSRQGKSFGSNWLFASPYGRAPSDPVRLVGTVAAVLSIAAGVIHVSAAGDHTNLPVMFAGFMLVATLQVALGGMLMWRRPSRLLIAAALGLMVSSLGLWLLSRTAGLPFLEGGHQEPIGFKDGVTKLFELGAIPPLLLLLSPDLANVSLPSPRLPSQVRAVLGAGCFALLTPALLLGGGGHHSHDQAVEMGIHERDGGHDEAHELAQAGSESGHTNGGDDHHAGGGDEADVGDRHDHAGSANAAGGHQHPDDVLASTPLDPSHEHSGGDPHSDAPRQHADGDHQRDHGDGQQHNSRPDDEHGDNHSGGGHGDGGHGDGSDGEDPVSVSYEPEPSVCISPGGTNVCFP